MRHRKKGSHLSRTRSHRLATMRNMAAQVIEHKEIRTTTNRAKALRGYVERLITYGKKGSLHHRRLAFKWLQNKNAVTRLFDEIAPNYKNRPGGYTRIIKLGKRAGDGADLSLFQLVDFEQAPLKKKEEEKKAKKGKKKEEEPQAEAAETQASEPEEASGKGKKPEVKDADTSSESSEKEQK